MLACPACDRTYESGPDEPWRCTCGHALEFAERPLPDGPAPDPVALDTRPGLWTFTDFLPMDSLVTLGEGWTPLVDAPDWNAQFKLEYVFPTGSFKDRGATTTLSQAKALGVETVIEDSSGNAGAAIATYAARAGIDAEIYVPASVKPAKRRAIERAGATVIPVEGSREAVTDACIEAVERGEGWYASHAWNPTFFAGTQTVAFEIAAQRDWDVPDAVVLPLGHGTLFLGAYRGFKALLDAGWTDEMPRLLGAQAAGFAPIADELHGDSGEQNDVADGIQIREPARKDQILEAIRETGGDAIAVGEAETARELENLHRAGFYVEPTCAAAPAALSVYRERGELADSDDVVVPLTGSGLKMR
ncbi:MULTISPECIES: threonine synthase [unclassified Haladaptatus]|uniref:threonine synthase n=1 Tax=unclassified Haladaptatus TaxID=2622732 RepID=UPI0023E8745E|nr:MULTISPECIES: threonine synthase [unclassified Haladaptatus]